MKKYLILPMAAAALLFTACGDSTDADMVDTVDSTTAPEDSITVMETPYSMTFTDVSSTYSNLPALHSYSMGQDNSGNMLLVAGRTNGLHNFNPTGGGADFPTEYANHHLFAYNMASNTLDSLDVTTSSLNDDLKALFTASNTQHIQEGDFLYVCGGYYGSGTDADSTLDIIARLRVDSVIMAINDPGTYNVADHIISGRHDILKVTGGEMFVINSKFYLALGQEFNGTYNDYISGITDSAVVNTIQVYKNHLAAFDVTADNGSLSVSNVTTHTMDGYDEFTNPMRRRDLNVVPNVNPATGNIGLTAYAGVFVCGNPPTCTNASPYASAVHMDIDGSGNVTTSEDANVNQYANVYACYNMQLYDTQNTTMYSNMIGGLGDGTAGNDDWTKLVTTLIRQTAGTTPLVWGTNTSLPDYNGAEGQFLMTGGADYLYSGSSEIMSLDAMPQGTPVTVGYLYGGIWSSAAKNGTTTASGTMIEVTVTKL